MERRNVLVKAVLCVASGFSEAFGEGITGNFQLCDLKGVDKPEPKIQVPFGTKQNKTESKRWKSIRSFKLS